MKKLMILLLLAIVGLASATTIYDIQYTTDPGSENTYPSTLENQEVTVTGIVTGNKADTNAEIGKFFMTDPEGGAWHGIYVFDWSTNAQPGDMVEVTGTVAEYFGYTELKDCTVTIVSQGNEIPSATIVTTNQMNDAATAEQYEGCLVKTMNLTVTEAANQYAQWKATDGTGAAIFDDRFHVRPDPSVGDTFSWVMGCVEYSFGNYVINPRTDDDIQSGTSVSNNRKSWGSIKSIYK